MTPEGMEPFDVVLMNPPFAHEQDIAHVTHAIKFLRPGGRLVAICSSGVTFHGSKAGLAFRELVRLHSGHIEALPADTFKASGTCVNTVLLWLTVPGTPDEAHAQESAPETIMDVVCDALLAAVEEVQTGSPVQMPEPEPPTMQTLADTIATQAEQTKARLARERLELAWQSKKSPTKPQAAPCGLFAQTQGALL